MIWISTDFTLYYGTIGQFKFTIFHERVILKSLYPGLYLKKKEIIDRFTIIIYQFSIKVKIKAISK